MIDLGLNTGLTQPLIGQTCPQGTHGLQVVDPLAPGFLRIQLGTQAFGLNLAGGAQDVRVVVAVVTGFTGRVDRHIDGAAFAVGYIAGEVEHELSALRCRQLGRQGDFELTRNASVLALLRQLGGVPERGPVSGPQGSTVGQH